MEPYKSMPIKRMTREQKIQCYLWRVSGLDRVIQTWAKQMDQPMRDGTFDGWEQFEAHGQGITELMDKMIALAAEVEPESVKLWQQMKDTIINLRIRNYEIMKRLEGPHRPPPTPEEEAAAKAEEKEARRSGGANLIRRDPPRQKRGGINTWGKEGYPTPADDPLGGDGRQLV